MGVIAKVMLQVAAVQIGVASGQLPGVPCNVPTADQASVHFTVSPTVSGAFPGSDVTYQCEDGYQTSDPMAAQCDTDGNYKYPTCTGMPVLEVVWALSNDWRPHYIVLCSLPLEF